MRTFGIDNDTLRSAVGFAVEAAREGAPTDASLVEARCAERVFAVAAWSCLVEPGDSVAAQLVLGLGASRALEVLVERRTAEQICAELTDATHESPNRLDVGEIDKGLARWTPRLAERTVLHALGTARRVGLALVLPGDPRWPEQLDALDAHAPLCLWARGDLRAVNGERSIAIVGARAATSYGEHVAMELSAELTGRGFVVVSGAAYGIDGVAHRAALAAGGPTVAVLAGGADRAYPAGHAELLDRIQANGVVLSELPPGAAPTRWRFLQRNRIIAALGAATVVVEAGARSGSLNTAAHAATLGRPVGAVPGPVTSAASAGCHRLLREFGAECITSVDDVVEMAGGDGLWGRAATPSPPTAPGTSAPAGGAASRTDDSTRVMDALSARTWRMPADVAVRAGLSLAEAESFLGVLALEGRVERGDSGWRVARRA